MGARQRQWAKAARLALVVHLGDRCRHCGATSDLELDCIAPQGHGHHRLDPARRVSFYRRQFIAGNLQVLCKSCNARKSNSDYEICPF